MTTEIEMTIIAPAWIYNRSSTYTLWLLDWCLMGPLTVAVWLCLTLSPAHGTLFLLLGCFCLDLLYLFMPCSVDIPGRSAVFIRDTKEEWSWWREEVRWELVKGMNWGRGKWIHDVLKINKSNKVYYAWEAFTVILNGGLIKWQLRIL